MWDNPLLIQKFILLHVLQRVTNYWLWFLGTIMNNILFCCSNGYKKFFAWLKSRSFWHLMKSRGKNKNFPSNFVQPFFREANGVHHEWLKAKIMRRNQWKNFHLHLNCQCRVYWHIDISIIVWILQILSLNIFVIHYSVRSISW